MFGAVCSGRPVQLATQMDTSKYVITIPNASHVSYITIFLLPNSDFVDINYTALVYFQLPNSEEYKLLGGLNPAKPSAIYKLNNNSPTAKRNEFDDIDMSIDDVAANTTDSTVINIGISIETTAQAEFLISQEREKSKITAQSITKPITPTIPKTPNDTAVLANKIVGHAYNHLSSFLDSAGKVPIKAFDTWWEKFKVKLNTNPNFLDTLQA
ncbi:uncharacterized protein RJT20DRAFT_62986 [Scheffersomyces xylosifermentans]|uniref:uncharacterized protein n=1 Tax=Scheffersomyces xylosifermentans TaxID=1304137 RepID=UPI00315DC2AB